MGTTNIGKWSAQATIDAGGMSAGAQQVIDQANRVKSTIDKTFESLKGGSASSALSSFGGLLSSPIARVTSLAAGVVGLAESFRSLSSHAMEAANAQRTLQFQFGMSGQSAAAFTTWGRLAGLDGGAMVSALQNVMRHFGEMQQAIASGQGSSAADALQRLGLSVGEIAHGDVAGSIARIGDALRGVENPAERMALAHQVLGREWRELMPLLLQGTQGLSVAQAHSHALTEEELRALRAIRMEIAIAGQEMEHLATRAGGWFAMRWREISATFAGEYIGTDPLGRDVAALDAEIRRRQAQARAQSFGLSPSGSGGALGQAQIDEARRIQQQEEDARRQAESARQQRDDALRMRFGTRSRSPLEDLFVDAREINRLFGGQSADDQYDRRLRLAQRLNQLPGLGEAPLLGSLSMGGADTASILQAAASPTVDRLGEIQAVIESMAEAAGENRRQIEAIAGSADGIVQKLEDIWRDFFTR